MKARGKTRSPIRVPPARQAGHSLFEALAEEANRFFYGFGFGGALLIAGIMSAVSLFLPDWWRAFVLPFVFVVGGLIICLLTLWRGRCEIPSRTLGLDGERSVGDSFRSLERLGYRVVHDIPPRTTGHANIDHVVIGPTGVFIIETKTFSKHDDTEQLHYDGERVRVGTRFETDAPIKQVRAIASDLADRLRNQLVDDRGRRIRLQPVVLFPGWYVNSNSYAYSHDVWVLSNKYLVTGLRDYGVNGNRGFELDDRTVDRIARVLEEDLSHVGRG